MDQSAFVPALKLNRPDRAVICRLTDAIAVVRAHAIETGELSSIRLVRLMKDATSPDEVLEAGEAFRAWALARGLGSKVN
jgi:hypothetical protein